MNLASTRSLVIPALLAASSGTAHAQLIAYDGFAYSPNTSLNAVGNGGIGWAGPWSPSYGANWMIDTVGSSYISQGLSLQKTGRRVTGASCGSQRSITLGTPLGNTAGSVWVSFIAQQTSGSTAANWLGVKFPCTTASGVDQFIYIGKPYTKPAWGLDPGGLSRHQWGAASVYNKSFVVARIDFRTGLDDVRVWVNPPLFGTPANNSASVTALNVGNFEGITKAILEVGSTSGVAAGNIDELRIGRSYADVAPWVDGIMFQGRRATALGNAEIAQSDGALSISNLGSTGNDGVRIDMGSRGAELALALQPFSNGQSITTANVNALGNTITSSSLGRSSSGNMQASADFSGIPGATVSSVRVEARDAAGNIVSSYTVPGSSATTEINAIAPDLPCPFQTHAEWVRRSYYLTNSDGSKTAVVYYERVCVSDFAGLPVDPFPWISFTADLGVTAAPFDDNSDIHSVVTTGTNLAGFTVLHAAGRFHDLHASGIGDAELSERCTNCSDPDARELTIDGNGGASFDLTQIQPCSSVEARMGHSGDTTTPAVGRNEFRVQGRDAIHGNVSASLVLQSDGLGGGTAQLLSEGAIWCRYTVTDQGATVASWEGPPQALAMQIPKYVNKWVKFWCEVGPTWPGLSAQFENYFTVALASGGGGGGGSVSGNGFTIEVLGSASNVVLTNFFALAQNCSEPMIITDIDTNTHNPCPADFNQDGFLDGFDYDDFVAAFEGAGPGDADFNRDGFVDGFDYDSFVEAFETGC